VLIAGGTGITPFCAFMDAALAQGRLPVEEAILHYGARTPELLIYRALADRCAAQVPGFKVRYYAEEMRPGQDSDIRPGSLDVASIVADTEKLNDTAFYLSGPKLMIDAFQMQLVGKHGVAPEQVLIDAWG
jgi:ferredoxin-NADP reductase